MFPGGLLPGWLPRLCHQVCRPEDPGGEGLNLTVSQTQAALCSETQVQAEVTGFLKQLFKHVKCFLLCVPKEPRGMGQEMTF